MPRFQDHDRQQAVTIHPNGSVTIALNSLNTARDVTIHYQEGLGWGQYNRKGDFRPFVPDSKDELGNGIFLLAPDAGENVLTLEFQQPRQNILDDAGEPPVSYRIELSPLPDGTIHAEWHPVTLQETPRAFTHSPIQLSQGLVEGGILLAAPKSSAQPHQEQSPPPNTVFRDWDTSVSLVVSPNGDVLLMQAPPGPLRVLSLERTSEGWQTVYRDISDLNASAPEGGGWWQFSPAYRVTIPKGHEPFLVEHINPETGELIYRAKVTADTPHQVLWQNPALNLHEWTPVNAQQWRLEKGVWYYLPTETKVEASPAAPKEPESTRATHTTLFEDMDHPITVRRGAYGEVMFDLPSDSHLAMVPDNGSWIVEYTDSRTDHTLYWSQEEQTQPLVLALNQGYRLEIPAEAGAPAQLIRSDNHQETFRLHIRPDDTPEITFIPEGRISSAQSIQGLHVRVENTVVENLGAGPLAAQPTHAPTTPPYITPHQPRPTIPAEASGSYIPSQAQSQAAIWWNEQALHVTFAEGQPWRELRLERLESFDGSRHIAAYVTNAEGQHAAFNLDGTGFKTLQADSAMPLPGQLLEQADGHIWYQWNMADGLTLAIPMQEATLQPLLSDSDAAGNIVHQLTYQQDGRVLLSTPGLPTAEDITHTTMRDASGAYAQPYPVAMVPALPFSYHQADDISFHRLPNGSIECRTGEDKPYLTFTPDAQQQCWTVSAHDREGLLLPATPITAHQLQSWRQATPEQREQHPLRHFHTLLEARSAVNPVYIPEQGEAWHIAFANGTELRIPSTLQEAVTLRDSSAAHRPTFVAYANGSQGLHTPQSGWIRLDAPLDLHASELEQAEDIALYLTQRLDAATADPSSPALSTLATDETFWAALKRGMQQG